MKKNKISIAFLVTALYGGGAERNIINLSIYLKKIGIAADIISLKSINDYKNQYKNFFRKIKVINILKDRKKISKITLPFNIVYLLIKLIIIIRNNKYNVLIASDGFLFLYIATSILAKILLKKSVIVVGNNISAEINEKNKYLKKIYKFIYELCFFLSNKIVVVSKGLLFDLMNNFRVEEKKLVLIYNAVDLKRIISLSKKSLPKKYSKFFKNNFVITSMGRLIYSKNFISLIKVFKFIKKKFPLTKLLIVGKGPLRKKIKKIVKKLKLENDVYIHGFESENPFVLLKNSKIFVFNSSYEGFGNVIVEAMVCGLPIISTDCQFGPREILCANYKDYKLKIKKTTFCKYGILVPNWNKSSPFSSKKISSQEDFLFKGIAYLIKNKNLRKRYKNKALIRAKEFNINKMIKKYLELFKDLAESKR